MNREVIKNIRTWISQLENKVGEMIFGGANGSDLVDLLNEAIEVGNVSLMYASDLSNEELGAVEQMLALSSETVKSENAMAIEANMLATRQVVDKISVLFREKKLLLGHENDEKIKCA